MKRICTWLLSIALLATLCACGTATEDAEPSLVASPQEPEQATVQEATAQPMPTISPEAETLSACAGRIQFDDQGSVYTTVTRGEGLVYLPDLLPEDMTVYVYNLLVTQDTIYFAAKDEYFSLEPSSLYALDRQDGTITLLAQDASAGCNFCLVGERLFYESYDQDIRAISLTGGQTELVLPDALKLLDADSDYFYYVKADGGIYRNDSTGTTEGQVLDSYRSYWFFAQADALCDLTYQENNTLAVLEFRAGDGTLRTQKVLNEASDGLYAQGNTLYVSQPQSHSIWVFDMSTGEQTGSIPLPEDINYCFIQAVADDALYFQTVTELWVISLNGDSCEYLGDILYG